MMPERITIDGTAKTASSRISDHCKTHVKLATARRHRIKTQPLTYYRRSLFGQRRLRDIALPLPFSWIVAMHALIIEDESFIALAIELVLRDCGFNSFDFAISESSAVDQALRNCPDLITSDVRLNPGSGIEAIASICRSRPIPVIFVTGNAGEARARYPQHAILTKPFTDDALRIEVARAIASLR